MSGVAMPVVTLIGYRGTGKSTVAAALAAALECGWVDADLALEAACKATIAELIRERGEGGFRDAEAALLGPLLEGGAGVVATGGGVVLRPGNRDLLRTRGGLVVWLTAPASVIRGRLAADPATATRRPALGGGDVLGEIDAALAAREALYRECAGFVVDASARSPAAIAAAILERLEGPRPAGSGVR
jgi:shikimate kinase